ncbi:MAG: SHOCT domain-containing protein [Firmicutes bacterium]|nr:SHOCT domain-containing protein [Bacillota bacterium]
MTKRVKGMLLGGAASLTGVVLWIVLGAFLDVVSGWAALLIPLLFGIVYMKINPEDKNMLPVWVAIPLTLVLLVLAELIVMIILCGMYEFTIAEALAVPDILIGLIRDLAIGVGFGAGGIVIFGFMLKKGGKVTPISAKTDAQITVDTKIDRLNNLNDMRAKGLINKEEFEASKKAIMEE